ncbi:unnamed protein product [Rotaria sp. Silwood1]|nr:unnamed protein product [Rotaria sp. Silwood1]CAF1453945.1 unnamed protein product [Rotaria sp. Silwood1]
MVGILVVSAPFIFNFLVWTTDPLQRLMIGFSFVPYFQVRLPVGDEPSLIKGLHGSSEEINNNPLIRLLASGNQNTMGQIITLISQELNKMNIQNIYNTLSSKY